MILELILLAGIAAGLEIATTGFEFGVSNNVYHIPIVLGYGELPQFRGDEYYQTLRAYSSLVWPALSLITTPRNIYWVFFFSYVFTVWLYLLVLLHVVSRLAQVGLPQLILASLILATSYLDSGYSRLAGHDLVAGYFTQTELTTPMVLFALSLCVSGRFIPAIALIGLIFDVNVFVAAWAMISLLATSLWLLRHWTNLGVIARGWVIGGCIALLVAAPVLLWIAQRLGSAADFEGDYVAFLRWFYPNHYLIGSASIHQIVFFLSAAVLGASGLALLGREGRAWQAAFVGFLVVFGFGCIVPALTHNPLVLNLHPLRADGFVQVIATIASVAVVVRYLSPGTTRARAAFAIGVTACLLLSRYLLPIAALMMLFRWMGSGDKRQWPASRRRAPEGHLTMAGLWAPSAVIAFVIAACVIRKVQPLDWLEPEPQRNPDFVALTGWAQAATDPFSIFLVNGERNSIFDKFQMLAQRRVWVDMRQSAAVTWAPQFYQQWQPRAEAVQALHTWQERLAYGCREKLDYYVDDRLASIDLAKPEIAPYVSFQNTRFFSIDLRRYCAESSRN